MLFRTHSSASSQSRTARLSGAPSSRPKPSTPSRYDTDTTTTPSRGNAPPSYHGDDGDPLMKPPPWIQT